MFKYYFPINDFFIIDSKYAMNFKQQRHMKNKLKNLPKKYILCLSRKELNEKKI